MKTPHPSIIATLLGVATLATANAEIKRAGQQDAKAEATATTENHEGSSSYKKTVTVTSDGKQTIRKTVIIRDGKEEIITEITDALGKVIRRKGNDDKSDDSDAADSDSTAEEDPNEGPWLGVRVESASSALRDQLGLEEDEGVVVAVLANDSPASKADIRVNDILLSIDETKLSTPSDLRNEISKHEVGDIIQLKVLRKGQKSDISVTLEEKKKDDDANESGDKPAKPDRSQGNTDDKNEVHIEIDGDGGHASATATSESSTGSSFDDILDDPNVPENFKKTVREMRDRMRDFQDQHGIEGDKDKNRGEDGNRVD
jgi:hypothetical protein